MLSLKNVKVPIDYDGTLEDFIKNYLKRDIIDYKIIKKSIDARSKHEFCYIYEFGVIIKDEEKYLLHNKNKNITKYAEIIYTFPKSGNKLLKHSPVVVGLGPAGLFASYFLAKHGYKPIIFERGKRIEERIKDVEAFWRDNILDKNSNVQFGEGGAGTFSDGKLNTQVKDKEGMIKEVLRVFVECGAPNEIMYEKNPHIGTDNLRLVVKNLREKILEYGGVIHYNSTLEDIIIKDEKIDSIVVNGEVFKTNALILAIGHSAKDTFNMLYERKVNITSKPFAIGIRIVHPQVLINKCQYPIIYPNLPSASYKLTYNASGRGVYSFCMCPGGFVVNASSDLMGVVTNGMSNYLRNSGFANSAIIVTVNASDFGPHPLDGLKYVESIEKKTYELTKGYIPIQKFIDYEKSIISSNILDINKFVKGSTKYIDINEILPEYINSSLKEGINHFNKLIPGFNEGIILAPETRTSSPVRIVRNDLLESNITGLYPCGEGSGYAGGITTSAVDGIKVAEMIAKKYQNML